LLQKTIYGLVQAAREWWKKIVRSLKELGYESCQSDSGLLIRRNEKGTVILCIYVDDVCCVGDEEAVKTAIKEIEAIYNIKHVGELSEYVGVTIEKGIDGSIIMSQPDTIKKIKSKFGKELNALRKAPSPAGASDVVMRPIDKEETVDEETQGLYRSGVGMLLWMTKHTRPDISNAVREASKVMDGATSAH
jgi:copper chaperone CopZ